MFINSDVIEVLAAAGNSRLGGDDFDQCITYKREETAYRSTEEQNEK